MVQQIKITLKPKRRGFHLVTSEIVSQLPKLPKTGIVNIFTKHTSCGLSINENCDPDVRVDMETQHHHPYHRWPSESRHLARYLLLRVQEFRWCKRVGSNNYRRIGYDRKRKDAGG